MSGNLISSNVATANTNKLKIDIRVNIVCNEGVELAADDSGKGWRLGLGCDAYLEVVNVLLLVYLN